jgi:predicted phosphate transport protein (TIGR00153 family)
MFNINQKEDKFYSLFCTTSKIIIEISEKLNLFMEDLSDAETLLKDFEELEHKGDRQMHLIMKELNKSFITPIDREDIYVIAKVMDDIIDLIESAANRFVMFNVKEATPHAKQMAALILESSKELICLMEELKSMKKSTVLNKKIIEINRIEDEGDTIFRVAVTELFKGDIDTLEVIKWREIYEKLEYVLDAFEDVADTIEGVVMKHA